MSSVFAIAHIALRAAFRSRLVVTMIIVLAVVNIVLPLTVKDNGTIASKVQVLVSYTLVFSQGILAIATLWSACAAVSTEIQDQNIHLVVSKPVARLQVWLGKWLGLLMMNALLLLITGLTVYGLLRFQTRSSVISEEDQIELQEQILISRQQVRPVLPDVDTTAREQLRRIQARGQLGAGDPGTKLEELRQRMLFLAFSAPMDKPVSWEFQLPNTPSTDHPVFLNYKFNAGFATGEFIRGTWSFGTRERPDDISVEVEHVAGANTVKVPVDAIQAGKPLIVTYANHEESPYSLQFDPKTGLSLLYHRGSFEGNLLRTLLVMFFQLGFYAAIGLTAGTLFSMPVAAFTSMFVILMQFFGRFIGEMSKEKIIFGKEEGMGPAMEILNAVVLKIYQFADLLLKPLQAFNPFEYLSTGVQIGWSTVAIEFLIKVVLYGGVTGVLGILLFNRREIGIPQ